MVLSVFLMESFHMVDTFIIVRVVFSLSAELLLLKVLAVVASYSMPANIER